MKPLQECCDLMVFKMAAICHVGFLKSQIANCAYGS